MHPFRRRSPVVATITALLLGVVLAGAPATFATGQPPTNVRGINVESKTIPQLQRLMNEGKLSSEALVRFYLKRIEALNPKLKAVIAVNKSAIDDARRADRHRRNGVRLPLLGIPVMVKDNVNTTGMATTAGSLALKNSRPGDAFIVKRMKAHGAVIIGRCRISPSSRRRRSPDRRCDC